MCQPNPSPAHALMSSYILCGGQTLPHHSSSCLVISCVSVKPFPLSLCLFLVILTQHNMTRNTDISFPLPLIIVLYVCWNVLCLCVCECVCVCVRAIPVFSQPDGLVFSLLAPTSAALTHQWVFLQWKPEEMKRSASIDPPTLHCASGRLCFQCLTETRLHQYCTLLLDTSSSSHAAASQEACDRLR